MKSKPRRRDRLVPLLLIGAAYAIFVAVVVICAWVLFQEVWSFFHIRE